MPLGLIKNRLAEPNAPGLPTPSVPKIVEGLFPVTRLRMFVTPTGLSK
jgi:hypothetical protein